MVISYLPVAKFCKSLCHGKSVYIYSDKICQTASKNILQSCYFKTSAFAFLHDQLFSFLQLRNLILQTEDGCIVKIQVL